MDLILDLLIILLLLVVGVILYFNWAFAYWKRKGVPYIQPKFPFGSAENPFRRKEHIHVRLKRQYDYLKSQGYDHGGGYFFSTPIYIPINIEYIKNILSKDFHYFSDRGMYCNEKDDPLSVNIMSTDGQRWRNLRKKLTPVFTISKIKMIFPKMVVSGMKLVETMKRFSGQKQTIDAKDICSIFTLDIITSYVFGFNSSKCQNDFRKYGKTMFLPMTKMEVITSMVAYLYPNLARFLKITANKPKVAEHFLRKTQEVINVQSNNSFVVKSNFVQILTQVSNGNERLSIAEIAAQAYVFFLAGYETSATTLSFCLYELASNMEIQEKLRSEVVGLFAKRNEDIFYDDVSKMPYLNQVVHETLRKYPPVPCYSRFCVKDYQVPNTDLKIEKGTHIVISTLGLHHDPEYFPNPEKFNPERFSNENKNLIPSFAYIPFGEGPRICIGLQLGLMQVKVGLALLLRHLKFTIGNGTNVPLAMDPFTFILAPKDEIWLNVENI